MVRARAQVEAAVASGASVLLEGNDAVALAEVAEVVHYRRHSTGEVALWRVEVSTALPSQFSRTLGSLLRADELGTLIVESIDGLQAEQQLELLTAMTDERWQTQVLATLLSGSDEVEDRPGMSDELAAAVSTIAIDIPRLADRPEDIPPLVNWHLARLNRESDDADLRLADDTLDVLMVYAWPGEGPELTKVLTSAFRRATGTVIHPSDLPKLLHHAVDHAAMAQDRPEPIDLDAYLDRVEAALVERALELASGNKAEAARLLGVSRPRLYRKLEQMDVVTPTPAKREAEADVVSQPPTSPEPEPSTGGDIEFLPVEGEE